MFGRKIIRFVTPTALRFYSSTAAVHNPKFIKTCSRPTPVISSKKIRSYSQASTENLATVDFDYVKRVSSQNEVMIVDVREPDEIKEHGKIPNSVNIPLGSINTSLALSEKEFQQSFNRTKPKENTEIIFYCMIGKRSGKAQQTALNLGFKNAKNYLGSWIDWAAKNQ